MTKSFQIWSSLVKAAEKLMSRSDQQKRELLEGIWQHLFVWQSETIVRQSEKIPTLWLDGFVPQSAMPVGSDIDLGNLIASLQDAHELECSLRMTIQQLSSNWQNIRPDARAAILKLGHKHNNNAVLNLPDLSPSERRSLSVRWAVSVVMYRTHRNHVLSELRDLGIDLEREVFVAGAMSIGEIIPRLPEALASLVRARIDWDLAAALVAGDDVRPLVHLDIKDRAKEEMVWALDRLRATLHSLRREDGVPSIAQIEPMLEPVRVAIDAVIAEIDQVQPTSDQLSSFRIHVGDSPTQIELPPPTVPKSRMMMFLERERERRGTLWLIIAAVVTLILAVLQLL